MGQNGTALFKPWQCGTRLGALATSPSHSLFWTFTCVRNLNTFCVHPCTCQEPIHDTTEYRRFSLPGFPSIKNCLTDTFSLEESNRGTLDETEDRYSTHNYVNIPATNEPTFPPETWRRIPWSRASQRLCAVAVPSNALSWAHIIDICQIWIDTDAWWMLWM